MNLRETLVSLALFIARVQSVPLSEAADDVTTVTDTAVTDDQGFRYYIDTTVQYAVSVPAPTATTTYAPPYSELESIVGSLSTTTWGSWSPNATNTATDSDDPYGQSAWFQLWASTSFANFSLGMYSTTVSPTPIPTQELVLPQEDPVSRAFENFGVKFPKDFIMGVAGSAAQIEGATSQEGKAPSVIDFTAESLSEPGDYVTNENYYLYKQDIVRLAAAGVEYYSFSIPWTRILPFTFPGTPVNKQAIDHYDDLINTVIEYGMKPIVTLIHFDSPAPFYYGGSTSISSLNVNASYASDEWADAFYNYGKIVMSHYGDRVPIWITINEPSGSVLNANGVKNVVMVTAKLHDFYHNDIKGTGKVGIKFSDLFGYPKDPSNAEDVAAADRFNEFNVDMFANPLYSGEDWPESFKQTALIGFEETASWSAEELAYVKGGADFLGIDPYTYTVCSALDGISLETCQANSTSENWPICANQTQTDGDGWQMGYQSNSYVYITPQHLRVFMSYLWQRWHVPIFITEFGFPEWDEADKTLPAQQYDLARSIYYRSFLTAALEASAYDGVEMMGALAWSFIDNWEFGDYDQHYGMQAVNRTTLERSYKKSMFDFVSFIKNNRET